MKSDPATTPLPECHEGKEAAKRFDAMMGSLLSVPHSVIVQREKEYREHVAANPNRRGPKSRKKAR